MMHPVTKKQKIQKESLWSTDKKASLKYYVSSALMASYLWDGWFIYLCSCVQILSYLWDGWFIYFCSCFQIFIYGTESDNDASSDEAETEDSEEEPLVNR